MTDIFIENENIKAAYSLEPGKTFEQEFSAASIESILFYSMAFCVWVLEKIFDALKIEIAETIAALKPHTPQWYAEKIKAFQLGFNLIPGTDQFDNSASSETAIAASKIIAYVAVEEAVSPLYGSYLRGKIAGEAGGELVSISEANVLAVKAYVGRIKDAGVFVDIASKNADNLKMSWRIFYDPLILDSTGARLDGSDAEPVRTAIKAFLKNLPFNGVYWLASHTDALQLVDGVEVPVILNAEAKFAFLPFSPIGDSYRPDAGWMRFANDADLTIIYQPYGL